MSNFIVTMVHGPNFDRQKSLRTQAAWDAHAEFMDGLVGEKFVILGGPIREGERALLIVDADDEESIRERMDKDPWNPLGILEIGGIEPWAIWLDGVGVTRPS